jgi:hypothetical protein
MGNMCKKCHGVCKLVLGLLLIGWFKWSPATDWRLFFGGLLVLVGLLKLFGPCCKDCESCSAPAPKGKKK